MPSVPEDQDFKHKVKAKAYRVVERAGLVWVYMGERAEAPPLPGFEVLDLPPDEINVSLMQRDCNWLQALEGEIDTAHFGFLHGGHVKPEDVPENEPFYNTITNRAPQYHVADAPWGTQYAGYRSAGPGRTYWRFANFLFPCWSQAPTASSTATCMPAAGCRSTTATPCSSSSGGSMPGRRRACPSPGSRTVRRSAARAAAASRCCPTPPTG